jgi:hypothetical protein
LSARKKKQNGTETVWWTASPGSGLTTVFCAITYTDVLQANRVSASSTGVGVVPVFCVK